MKYRQCTITVSRKGGNSKSWTLYIPYIAESTGEKTWDHYFTFKHDQPQFQDYLREHVLYWIIQNTSKLLSRYSDEINNDTPLFLAPLSYGPDTHDSDIHKFFIQLNSQSQPRGFSTPISKHPTFHDINGYPQQMPEGVTIGAIDQQTVMENTSKANSFIPPALAISSYYWNFNFNAVPTRTSNIETRTSTISLASAGSSNLTDLEEEKKAKVGESRATTPTDPAPNASSVSGPAAIDTMSVEQQCAQLKSSFEAIKLQCNNLNSLPSKFLASLDSSHKAKLVFLTDYLANKTRLVSPESVLKIIEESQLLAIHSILIHTLYEAIRIYIEQAIKQAKPKEKARLIAQLKQRLALPTLPATIFTIDAETNTPEINHPAITLLSTSSLLKTIQALLKNCSSGSRLRQQLESSISAALKSKSKNIFNLIFKQSFGNITIKETGIAEIQKIEEGIGSALKGLNTVIKFYLAPLIIDKISFELSLIRELIDNLSKAQSARNIFISGADPLWASAVPTLSALSTLSSLETRIQNPYSNAMISISDAVSSGTLTQTLTRISEVFGLGPTGVQLTELQQIAERELIALEHFMAENKDNVPKADIRRPSTNGIASSSSAITSGRSSTLFGSKTEAANAPVAYSTQSSRPAKAGNNLLGSSTFGFLPGRQRAESEAIPGNIINFQLLTTQGASALNATISASHASRSRAASAATLTNAPISPAQAEVLNLSSTSDSITVSQSGRTTPTYASTVSFHKQPEKSFENEWIEKLHHIIVNSISYWEIMPSSCSFWANHSSVCVLGDDKYSLPKIINDMYDILIEKREPLEKLQAIKGLVAQMSKTYLRQNRTHVDTLISLIRNISPVTNPCDLSENDATASSLRELEDLIKQKRGLTMFLPNQSNQQPGDTHRRFTTNL